MLSGAVGRDPFCEHRLLDPPHRFHLRDAGVGHAIHVLGEKFLLILRRELPVVRHPLVVVVRDQIENILFEVRAGADDQVHLVAPDHLRQRNAELGGRHRAGERDQHFAAGGEVCLVTFRGVEQRGGVKVAIILRDEFRDGTFFCRERGVDLFRALRASFGFHGLGNFGQAGYNQRM